MRSRISLREIDCHKKTNHTVTLLDDAVAARPGIAG